MPARSVRADRSAPAVRRRLTTGGGRVLAGLLTTAALASCGSVGASDPGSAGSSVPDVSTTPPAPVAVPTRALRSALGCPADIPVAVDHRMDVPTTHAEEVVAAHCDSAAGSPPSGVYVVSAAGGASRIAATLVPASAQIEVRALSRSAGTVRVSGLGYSAPSVPRCCPDVTVARAWSVRGDRFVPVG